MQHVHVKRGVSFDHTPKECCSQFVLSGAPHMTQFLLRLLHVPASVSQQGHHWCLGTDRPAQPSIECV